MFVEQTGTEKQLIVMFPDGSSRSVVHTSGSFLYTPNWSPDGKSIVFADNLQVARIDITWDNVTQTFGGANFTILSKGWDPAWSPLGNEIAFYTSQGNIALVPAAGGPVQILYRPPSGFRAIWPTWSSDGTRIAFLEAEGWEWNNSAFKILDRATGTVTGTLLPGTSGFIRFLDWAREGMEAIAFEWDGGIFTLDLTTEQVVHVTPGASPSWSPDNTKILFVSYETSGPHISIIDLASGSIQILEKGGWNPDWNWFGSPAAADVTAPSAVSDLAIDSAFTTHDSVDLTWTAPGDDGPLGNAYIYDVRYLANEPVTEENWNRASQASDEPVPQPGGSRERFTLRGLDPNTTYSFGLRAIDEWSNPSRVSNAASETTRPTPPPKWAVATVDGAGAVGEWASLEVDASASPHIAYHDHTNGTLKYAYFDGVAWNVEVVDDTEVHVGDFASLALDGSDNPSIAYAGVGDGKIWLKFARRIGSTWSVETVDATGVHEGWGASLALDRTGRPHIVHESWAGNPPLKYVRWSGSEWITDVVDRTDWTWIGLSIALDGSDRPHITYDDAETTKYARWTGSEWMIEAVGPGKGRTSLDLDGAGNPHVSYRGRNDELMYARRTGTTWEVKVVDRPTRAVDGTWFATSLELDALMNPHIAYQDAVNQDLKYAHWNGSAWVIEVVDSEGSVGDFASLALRQDGEPVFAYYHATDQDLKFARRMAPPALLRVMTIVDVQPMQGVPGKILLDGVPMDEWGTSWVKIPAGSHVVSFTDVPGLETPADVPIVAEAGNVVEITGVYTAKGWLRVTTDPPVPGTIVVDGIPRDDWGVWMAIAPGTHAVSFGDIEGYRAPPPLTVEVVARQLTTVVGSYAFDSVSPGPDPTSFGRLRVTTSVYAGGTFLTDGVMTQIMVDGVARDEWGLNWVKLPPGEHTLSFSDVPGLGTPAPLPFTILPGQTTVLEGRFQRHGWLRIVTDPPVSGTIFVDGLTRDDWGMWQSMPPGTYKVSFGPVPGYATPPSRVVTVTAGELAAAVGQYELPPPTAALAESAEAPVADHIDPFDSSGWLDPGSSAPSYARGPWYGIARTLPRESTQSDVLGAEVAMEAASSSPSRVFAESWLVAPLAAALATACVAFYVRKRACEPPP